MTPQLAAELFFWGGVLPAVVAAAVSVALLRLLPPRLAKRYGVAGGVGAAVLVGYALLPESFRPSLAPDRYWHWLPYLVVLAMLAGPLGMARGLILAERWLLFLLLAVLAAWLLVPTWPDLKPPRATYLPLMSAYFVLLVGLLDLLADRIPPRPLCFSLWISATASALAVWATVSETFGRVGVLISSAWFGIGIVSVVYGSKAATRAAAPIYAIGVGGATFVGFVYPPDGWEAATLILPYAPLALWAAVAGPLAKLSGAKRSLAQIGVVAAVLVVALLLLAAF